MYKNYINMVPGNLTDIIPNNRLPESNYVKL